MTYKEQIRSPQWIEFAAAFKKAKDWKCESCGAKQSATNELSVHHIYYMGGVMMWDHPEGLLECLCSRCHKSRQTSQQQTIADFAKTLNIRGGNLDYEWEPIPWYNEFDLDKARWEQVVKDVTGRFPVQSGYLNEALFGGVSYGSEVQLVFRDDHHAAARSLQRAALLAELESATRKEWSDFDHFEFLDTSGNPITGEEEHHGL